ncbi:MAG: PAS domain S-box protein [Cyclobacteriaceae bacterium]|nr:PAS domain S-box protein [Cyclobacteriaceae bacterium]
MTRLSNSNNLLSQFISNSIDGIMITNLNGVILEWNKRMEELFGWSKTEAVGKSGYSLMIPEESRELLTKNIKKHKKGGQYSVASNRNLISVTHKNGSAFTIEISITPVENETNALELICVFHELKDEKDLFNILLQTEKVNSDLRHALDQSAIIAITNVKGEITYTNEMFTTISGYSNEELIGADHRIINSGYHPKSFFKDLWKTIAQGKVWNNEVKNKAKDGSYYWVNTTIVPFVNDKGKPYQYMVVRFDITEEKAAIEEGMNLGEILEDSLNEIFIFNQDDLRFVNANKGSLKNMGYSLEEMCKMTPVDIKPEFTEQQFKDFIAPLQKNDVEFLELETIHERKNHSTYNAFISIQPAIYNKRPVFVAFVRDETEKKKVEKERLQFEKELQEKVSLLATIENIQAEFIKKDNKAEAFDLVLSHLLTFTQSEYGYIGEVLYKDNKPYIKTQAITNISWDAASSYQYDKYAKEGLEFSELNSLYGSVLTTGEPVISNNAATDKRSGGLPKGHPPLDKFLGIPIRRANKLIGIIGLSNKPEGYTEEIIENLIPYIDTCSNLLEALRLEKLRIQAQDQLEKTIKELKNSNEILDSFVYRVSHDLKSPIINFSSMILMLKESMDKNQSPVINKIIGNMDLSVNRMSEIIEGLLELSKIEINKGVKKTTVRLATSYNEIQNVFKTQINDIKATIQVDFTQCEEVYFSVTELNSVFQNFLTNSIKYRNQDKRLQIDIRSDKRGNFDIIYFSDNGIGMDLKKLGHKLFGMFERLHTSKAIEGTGIGLHIVKKLIEKAGGEIDVKSKIGEGTTFIISLPQK